MNVQTILMFKPIRVISHLVTYPTIYLPLKFVLLPLLCLFDGYKKAIVGTCVILAPPNQMQTILQGIEYLRTLDSEMYQRLTAERRYEFYYKKDCHDRLDRVEDIYSIPDNFLLWGKEGVVTCFVQTIIGSAIEQSPFKRSKLTHRQVQQQVFEWVRKHAFPQELVRQYEQFAEATS